MDGAGKPTPCVVYGQTFPVGQWKARNLTPAQALKLAGNPMFDAEGELPEVTEPNGAQPESDPDPEGE